MSRLSALSAPQLESLTISIATANRVRMQGTLTLQEPSRIVGGFLREVHEAALADGLTVLELDVTELKFVNSSAIRLFLDWAGWLKNGKGPKYKLQILTTRKFTWQKTSFVAITSLAAGCIELSRAD